MEIFRKLKFVRKIQAGFFILGLLGAFIICLSYFQVNKMVTVKDNIFHDYIEPQKCIKAISSGFQETQYIMMQFSMPVFATKFQENAKDYAGLKKQMQEQIDSLKKFQSDFQISSEINSIDSLWTQYKSFVADAILSASATHNYDMAADVATTDGEAFGVQLSRSLTGLKQKFEENADRLNTEIESDVKYMIMISIIGAILGTSVACFFIFYLAPAITKPINKLKLIVNEFSLGNFEVEIENNSRDEIGELTSMFVKLQNAQREKINAAEQIAIGNIQEVIPASEKDSLAISFNKEVETINAILREAQILIQANQKGDLELRGDTSKYSGVWGELIGGFNAALDAVVVPLNESSEVLSVMAEGDFTTKIKGDYQGYYQIIKNNINKVIDSMNSALLKVSESASAVASSSTQISASSEEMAAGAQEQTAQASEVAQAVEQMTYTILENTKNASLAASTAKNAGVKAKEGGDVVEDTIKGMFRISEVVQKAANTVQALGKSSDQIGEIIQVIEDIADQTNLLALNAAIEAARAGEQGRGFSVVADEVRKLAEKTTKATKEISGMIQKIQQDSEEAVYSIKDGTTEVENGKVLANKAGDVLKEIISNAEKVTSVSMQVADASEVQASAAEQITRHIESISNVTKETASGIHQIASSSEDLSRLTVNLQELINNFKILNSHSSFGVRANGKILEIN